MDKDGKKIADRQLVRTASIVVSNAGLQPARNVEVAFNWKPPILNVSPARSYSDVPSPFDRYSIKFDSLAPGEQVAIGIMSLNAELPLMTAVRSDDCQGQSINMVAQRVWPNWFLYSGAALYILGIGTVVYMFVRVVTYLAS